MLRLGWIAVWRVQDLEGFGQQRSLWMVDGNIVGKSKAKQTGRKSFKMLAHEDVFKIVARVIRCCIAEDHLGMFAELGDVKE